MFRGLLVASGSLHLWHANLHPLISLRYLRVIKKNHWPAEIRSIRADFTNKPWDFLVHWSVGCPKTSQQNQSSLGFGSFSGLLMTLPILSLPHFPAKNELIRYFCLKGEQKIKTKKIGKKKICIRHKYTNLPNTLLKWKGSSSLTSMGPVSKRIYSLGVSAKSQTRLDMFFLHFLFWVFKVKLFV